MNGTEVQMIFVAYRTHSRLSSRILPRTNLCYLVVLNIKKSGFICLNTHSSPMNNKAFFKPQIKIGAMCFSGSCDQLAWNGHMKFWIFFTFVYLIWHSIQFTSATPKFGLVSRWNWTSHKQLQRPIRSANVTAKEKMDVNSNLQWSAKSNGLLKVSRSSTKSAQVI